MSESEACPNFFDLIDDCTCTILDWFVLYVVGHDASAFVGGSFQRDPKMSTYVNIILCSIWCTFASFDNCFAVQSFVTLRCRLHWNTRRSSLDSTTFLFMCFDQGLHESICSTQPYCNPNPTPSIASQACASRRKSSYSTYRRDLTPPTHPSIFTVAFIIEATESEYHFLTISWLK